MMSLKEKAQQMWHVQRVKRLVRDCMDSAQCMVSVRETICTDPGCEGPATEIRVIILAVREIKTIIHKPAAEITSADVSSAF